MSHSASLRDYYVEIQRGNVPGHKIAHKFGDNLNVINGQWSMISTMTKDESMPPSGSPVRIKAGGNIADDASGAGCRSITLLGLDINFNEVTEILITNGVSASLSSIHSYWRLYRIEALDVGTYTGANSGTIMIENADGSKNRQSMRTDEGQSQHGAWSVGVGKKAYLIGIDIESDGLKAADFKICVRYDFDKVTSPIMSTRLKLFLDGIIGSAGLKPRSPSIILPQKSDIWVETRGSGANTEVSVDFELLIIDEPVSHIMSV